MYSTLDVLLPLTVGCAVVFFTLGLPLADIAQVEDITKTPVEPAAYAYYVWIVIWATQLAALPWLLNRSDEEDSEKKQAIVDKVGGWWIGGTLSEVVAYLFYANTASDPNRDAFLAAAALALSTAAFCFIRALFVLSDPPSKGGLTCRFENTVPVGIAVNAAWTVTTTLSLIVMTAPESSRAVGLAVVLACGAGDLALWVIWKTRSITFAVTWVWAFAAIFVAQIDFPVVRAVAAVYVMLYSAVAGVVAYTRVKGEATGASEGGLLPVTRP